MFVISEIASPPKADRNDPDIISLLLYGVGSSGMDSPVEPENDKEGCIAPLAQPGRAADS